MGQVIILNDTNVPINSCISAGVNYSWVNSLSPKEYYVHAGAAGVYTLNTRFWLGEGSEYANSDAEIGIWVAGIVLGIAGLVVTGVTGGAALPMLVAAGVGAAGATVSGISIAAKEFTNQASTWTNIQAMHDRKFVAEGRVDFDKGPDGLITWKGMPTITLRELSDAEFRERVASQEFVQYHASHDVTRITEGHQTKADLVKAGLVGTPLRIRPSLGEDAAAGPAWEVEDDRKGEGCPMQLWKRDVKAAEANWEIQAEEQPDNREDVFLFYNRTLKRYAYAAEDGRLLSGERKSSSQFYVIKSPDKDKRDCYVFMSAQGKLVFPENGNTGNSTKLRLAFAADGNPAWARWLLQNAPPSAV